MRSSVWDKPHAETAADKCMGSSWPPAVYCQAMQLGCANSFHTAAHPTVLMALLVLCRCMRTLSSRLVNIWTPNCWATTAWLSWWNTAPSPRCTSHCSQTLKRADVFACSGTRQLSKPQTPTLAMQVRKGLHCSRSWDIMAAGFGSGFVRARQCTTAEHSSQCLRHYGHTHWPGFLCRQQHLLTGLCLVSDVVIHHYLHHRARLPASSPGEA